MLLLLLLVSTNRFSILEPQWHLGAPLLFHQQAADELGGDLLGGAGEEGLGEVLRGRGGYGSGLEDEVKHQYPPQSHFAVWYSLSSAPTHVLFV